MKEESKFINFTVTPLASAELVRQSAYARTPGEMSIDLLKDTCNEGWLHIRLRPGKNGGVPIARIDGVTLFSTEEHLSFLEGLRLNYFGDSSGGGFLISTPDGAESCSCGSGFRYL